MLNNEWGYRTRKTKRMGGNPMAESTWYKLLSDPKIMGKIRRSEGIFNASFPKLLDEEDFDKIQVILGEKAPRRRTKKEWAYTGFIKCGCCDSYISMDEKWQIICSNCKTKFHKSKERTHCPKCSITISEMISPKILHYTWLICGKGKKLPDNKKCNQKSMPVKEFERKVDNILTQLEIPESFAQWAIEKVIK
jgi:hypothetical protein